ncbi:hypothetical protein IE81DRAFT_191195 [Ceraceosorus guamensis]|uniref:Uncharacterized protein n=1 Tax=Ceraceosorus guamensis TaxID=1522189 RepID=A0A316WC02_9BASI|nr:hypothetical protein IE81DRAFT_191195 [Ceraceosorus guamensis]PWN45443.1 hypothetical protein IE81DRAFT_191195 [Ceraceosorus guamensis]
MAPFQAKGVAKRCALCVARMHGCTACCIRASRLSRKSHEPCHASHTCIVILYFDCYRFDGRGREAGSVSLILYLHGFGAAMRLQLSSGAKSTSASMSLMCSLYTCIVPLNASTRGLHAGPPLHKA